MDYEDEEDQSEITDLVIQTHYLREEKIRLQEKLKIQKNNGIKQISRAKEAYEDIKRTYNDLEFQQTLLSSKSRRRNVNTDINSRTSRIAMTLEIDIQNEMEKLDKSKKESEAQKQEQQDELDHLLELGRKKKFELENTLSEIDNVKNKTHDMKKKIKSTEKNILATRDSTKQLKEQIREVDQSTANLVQEAEQYVHKRYRIKSKAIKYKD